MLGHAFGNKALRKILLAFSARRSGATRAALLNYVSLTAQAICHGVTLHSIKKYNVN
jgi:hypothetical protein